MNLLSLIIIFLALAIAGSIAFIAWELTSEDVMPRSEEEPDASIESNDTSGSGEQS